MSQGIRTALGLRERLADSPTLMRTVDLLTSAALRVTSPPWRAFSQIGPGRLPSSTRTLKQLGVFPIRDHYYYPLFNDAHLTRPLTDERNLPGIDWCHDDQAAFLEKLHYGDELRSLHLDRPAVGPLDFSLSTSVFGIGDAEMLYSVIRHFKPRRVVEIGSGDSTKLARVALARNATDDGVTATHVCVEPFENPWLDQLGVQVIRERVETVGLDLFATLGDGDLLFIDSSHVIRPQGDVLFEYLEVLPSLAPGVVVHVHDVFTPRDYPDGWVRQEVLMWGEQYLLEALLTDSDRYEVLAAVNHLRHSELDRLAAVCPYLQDEEPGSLYLRVR